MKQKQKQQKRKEIKEGEGYVVASLVGFGGLVLVVLGLVWVVDGWGGWMEDVERDGDGIFMEYSIFFCNNCYF